MDDRIFRIHGPRGVIERGGPAIVSRKAPRANRRTAADQIPIIEIMTSRVVCAFPDLGLDALVELMVEERLGCVPVVSETLQPLGMVTKFDIIQLFAGPPTRLKPTVSDVMMPLAITLDDKATVAHAAALMASEDMHHVMIVSERKLIGIVSTMDLTRWIAANDELPRR